jgi:hypothetical protein
MFGKTYRDISLVVVSKTAEYGLAIMELGNAVLFKMAVQRRRNANGT